MKKTNIIVILTLLLTSFYFSKPEQSRAAGFVVTHNFDDASAHDVSPGDGLCADTYGVCTLRAAVEEANAYPGTDTITFQTAMTIYVNSSSGSFQLNETAIIDASGVWDTANNAPGVTIDGGGGSFAGFYVGDDSCQIYGLYITNFGGDGILVVSASNFIGGSPVAQRNVLSGNDIGITLYGSLATGNIVRNNYIGLTPAGNTKNPNGTGVLISGGASDNIIGGNEATHVNYISGNTYFGVSIENSSTDNNWLGSNVIGLASDNSTNMGNGQYGIRIYDGATNTVIGGASNTGNIISYSGINGVMVENSGIGTQITDNLVSGNIYHGIDINLSSGCDVTDNIISGNTIHGVVVSMVSSTSNLIWANSIYGNGGKGIALLNGSNNGIAAPVINNASKWGASGTACPFCQVALYSDSGDEGKIYHDTFFADSSGNWSYIGGPLIGYNLTATSIDNLLNTSEFSTPYYIWFDAFLPMMVNNP
ncbi:MAG: right-handed parallel beta-helix repeat-containing protein [Anaerolineales bacterium]|nr:right-handed parallel beta-helix repeat-containing protein [Anaerolineales bacterium]